jgi:hypothetical protein
MSPRSSLLVGLLLLPVLLAHGVPSRARVSQPSDCRPIPHTTSADCASKRTACRSKFGVEMQFFAGAHKCQSVSKAGCDCSSICDLMSAHPELFARGYSCPNATQVKALLGQATPGPSKAPTLPTSKPTWRPSSSPTKKPTLRPTAAPTHKPSSRPSASPTRAPTPRPSFRPSASPTQAPTHRPSSRPSASPTRAPTPRPSFRPSASPTRAPAPCGGTCTAAGYACCSGSCVQLGTYAHCTDCDTCAVSVSSGYFCVGSYPSQSCIICFAAYSTVQLASGAHVRMDQLRVGDSVLDADEHGQLAFSPVVAFTGVFPNRTGQVMHIGFSHQQGGRISLSPVHLLFASQDAAGPPQDVQARHVQPGMYLWSKGESLALEPALVTSVQVSVETGWFTPLTASGTLMVDGVLASCHTTGPHRLVRALYAPWQWWLHYFPAPAGLPSKAEETFPFFTRVLRQGAVGKAAEALLRSVLF